MLPKLETIRSRTFELLNPATFGDQTSRLWDQFFSLLILLNVIAVTLESVDTLHEKYEQIFESPHLVFLTFFSVSFESCRVRIPQREQPLGLKLGCRFPPLCFLPLFLLLFSTIGFKDLLKSQ